MCIRDSCKTDTEVYRSGRLSDSAFLIAYGNRFAVRHFVRPPFVKFIAIAVCGPFSSFQGTIEAVDNERKKLTVSVKIFGRKTPMELSFTPVSYTHLDVYKRQDVRVGSVFRYLFLPSPDRDRFAFGGPFLRSA